MPCCNGIVDEISSGDADLLPDTNHKLFVVKLNYTFLNQKLHLGKRKIIYFFFELVVKLNVRVMRAIPIGMIK